ncbi:receptor-type tyrosine-protein phosphatase N2 isoform X1 [Polypterus senegalus]|uniref:receptor-type tyrosine-protein phosphatase N2 isoform X1 n=1 Tax=Polypterus senegalus TaxID=55291 RepID=UPI001963C478|nr:receptor-type tyrosine-protein phosphatase N2 isoform X1 [Polypterus senegalus]
MMDSLASFLIALLALFTNPSASADRKFGCLFQDELCANHEICLNDGVFGKCQRVPVIDVYRYEVSPPVVQHFRKLLQKLSHRGLTWQDDTTQQIISNELSKLRKIYYRTPETKSLDSNSKSRTSTQGTDVERNYGQGADSNLGRSLQQYLQSLGFLPQSAAPAIQKTNVEKLPMKNDAVKTERLRDYLWQKSQGRGHMYPLASPLQPKHSDRTLPAKFFTPFQADRASFPLGVVNFPNKQSIDSRTLLSALEEYLVKKIATQNTDEKSLDGKPKVLLGYTSGARSSKNNQVEGLAKNEEMDSSKGKKTLNLKQDNVSQRPKVLSYKPSSNSVADRDPLSLMDENFIQTMVKELGKHNINVEDLSPKDLDKLADVIAQALQVVDGNSVGQKPIKGQKEMKRLSFFKPQEFSEKSLGKEDAMPGNTLQKTQLEKEEDDKIPSEKDTSLVAKLIEYLDRNPITTSPFLEGASQESQSIESVRSDDSSEIPEEPVVTGVENVKSRTIQKALSVEKKSEEVDKNMKEAAELQRWIHEGPVVDESTYSEPQKKDMQFEEEIQLDVKSASSSENNDEYGYIVTNKDILTTERGLHLMEILAHHLRLQITHFRDVEVLGPAVTFQLGANPQNLSTADVAKAAETQKTKLEEETGLQIVQTGVGDKSHLKLLPLRSEAEDSTKFLILTVISIICIIGVLLASTVVYCIRHRSHHRLKEKLTGVTGDVSSDVPTTYQELCRQRMAVKTSDRPEPLHTSRINSVSSQFSDGPMPSPSTRSSTSSWCEEPVQSNMDISTGHMILSYMEDHLKNKNRLEKEWEALCAYQAEPNATTIALKEENRKKNRSEKVVAYDHSRITLKAENNHGNSDYINASPIMDHDPRNPAYISTQGPLPATVADFWQMVWENGCIVIVMLTPLTENGVKQCYQYWPDEGSNLYNIYEVNLVSEHIWCEDFLVRSFYLKNLQTNETRTVTQFHFLTWLNKSVPESARTLLDFRRKVNKCYRGRSCPIIVHCSDGAGRSGTYILIDMVLNKMAKGAKEIDIAATLEHLRDQRPGMVQIKEQFEFALTAVAEEVNAILKALPQ